MATRTQSTKSTTQEAAPATEELSRNLVVAGSGGTTTIDPDVVAKIAALAIREVEGVYALAPTGAGQAINRLARNLSGAEYRKLGVNVEVGQSEVAVDARIITEYGHSIPDIAERIRANVTDRIGTMTGLVAKEINLVVVDLHFAEDDARPEASAPRVQ